ncbi:hypothetical protein TNIN_393931 [Trichonephila inaurata madagascariensis]|uniref:Uncharacterized protein n=1 Tax=Trichonephila inaurata madagascariensis TaxID=2747483 RepID=A0A8X7CEB2_9ARAC|nr:hypothetical protein TNIN_188681 [Trichonephila inaurata madagascariensis]GFY66048.1 hypothetical protein TNIN_393931 [Trichonephila inaurata madagascariensis]
MEDGIRIDVDWRQANCNIGGYRSQCNAQSIIRENIFRTLDPYRENLGDPKGAVDPGFLLMDNGHPHDSAGRRLSGKKGLASQIT